GRRWRSWIEARVSGFGYRNESSLPATGRESLAASLPAVVVAEHRGQVAELERAERLAVDVGVHLLAARLGAFVGVLHRVLRSLSGGLVQFVDPLLRDLVLLDEVADQQVDRI